MSFSKEKGLQYKYIRTISNGPIYIFSAFIPLELYMIFMNTENNSLPKQFFAMKINFAIVFKKKKQVINSPSPRFLLRVACSLSIVVCKFSHRNA